MANEAKDSMRRLYKLRKTCANLTTGNSMLNYALNSLKGVSTALPVTVKGNTMATA